MRIEEEQTHPFIVGTILITGLVMSIVLTLYTLYASFIPSAQPQHGNLILLLWICSLFCWIVTGLGIKHIL